ncbi:cortex morphogenetic protein CmpA [Paenibacillus tengchongensis]|nr:cortex morphogenetic protein CmpA [Paenibacillus tengchongensis]
MPQWLCSQLMRAYYNKDRRQIKMLNECWFFYRNSAESRSVVHQKDG